MKEREGYVAKLVLATTGKTLEQTLREMYVTQRATQQEIADALGVSRWFVNTRLQAYGITRDERPPVVIEGASA